MRIAFCGASGTGKTTLATAVSERRGLPLNPVGSRSVASAMGFASPYDVDAAGKRAEFQHRLLAEKVAWELDHESFVTDRTTLDNLAYMALHDVRSIDREMLGVVQAGMLRYNYIVYCPVWAFCRLGGDPARVESLEYHEVYDSMLRGLLAKLPERLLVLDVGSLDRRVGAVDCYLDFKIGEMYL